MKNDPDAPFGRCINGEALSTHHHECGGWCFPDEPTPRPAWWRAYVWHWVLGAMIGGALGFMVGAL